MVEGGPVCLRSTSLESPYGYWGRYTQSKRNLFSFFNNWVEMPLSSDATRRVGMRDSVRIMNQLAPSRAELDQVVQGLTALREAVQAEGLDRPIARPETKQPSVEDLELVAWELVVGPDGLTPKL